MSATSLTPATKAADSAEAMAASAGMLADANRDASDARIALFKQLRENRLGHEAPREPQPAPSAPTPEPFADRPMRAEDEKDQAPVRQSEPERRIADHFRNVDEQVPGELPNDEPERVQSPRLAAMEANRNVAKEDAISVFTWVCRLLNMPEYNTAREEVIEKTHRNDGCQVVWTIWLEVLEAHFTEKVIEALRNNESSEILTPLSQREIKVAASSTIAAADHRGAIDPKHARQLVQQALPVLIRTVITELQLPVRPVERPTDQPAKSVEPGAEIEPHPARRGPLALLAPLAEEQRPIKRSQYKEVCDRLLDEVWPAQIVPRHKDYDGFVLEDMRKNRPTLALVRQWIVTQALFAYFQSVLRWRGTPWEGEFKAELRKQAAAAAAGGMVDGKWSAEMGNAYFQRATDNIKRWFEGDEGDEPAEPLSEVVTAEGEEEAEVIEAPEVVIQDGDPADDVDEHESVANEGEVPETPDETTQAEDSAPPSETIIEDSETTGEPDSSTDSGAATTDPYANLGPEVKLYAACLEQTGVYPGEPARIERIIGIAEKIFAQCGDPAVANATGMELAYKAELKGISAPKRTAEQATSLVRQHFTPDPDDD